MVGRGLLKYLGRLNDWDIIGAMRSSPKFETRAKFLPIDLTDRQSCLDQLETLPHITHAFYAACKHYTKWEEAAEPNIQMFKNGIDGLINAAPSLKNITIIQGPQYYGAHLGPYKTPSKENDPHHMPPNFFYSQEDYLRHLQRGYSWSWSAVRPQTVCSSSIGGALNLTLLISVYATISKELGLPLRWPGDIGAYNKVYQVTDSNILSKASVWVSVKPDCAGQAYNISNGDVFRWESMWKCIADYFRMELAAPQPIKLSLMMADKECLWNTITKKYHLAPIPFYRLVNWTLGDNAFNSNWDNCMNTNKCRKHGFLDVIKTENMFIQQFDELRNKRIIP